MNRSTARDHNDHVVEDATLFDAGKGDTLSEQVRRHVIQPRKRRGPKDAAPWVWAGRLGVVGLAGWLVFHFLTGV